MYKTKWTLKKTKAQNCKGFHFVICQVIILRRGETNLHSQEKKKRLNAPPQGSAKCSARISYQHQKNHQTNPLFHPFSRVKVRM